MKSETLDAKGETLDCLEAKRELSSQDVEQHVSTYTKKPKPENLNPKAQTSVAVDVEQHVNTEFVYPRRYLVTV